MADAGVTGAGHRHAGGNTAWLADGGVPAAVGLGRRARLAGPGTVAAGPSPFRAADPPLARIRRHLPSRQMDGDGEYVHWGDIDSDLLAAALGQGSAAADHGGGAAVAVEATGAGRPRCLADSGQLTAKKQKIAG